MKYINETELIELLKKTFLKMSIYEILVLYYRIEKHMTLKEIGDKLLCSNESIRLRLKKIYKLIRNEISKQN